MSVGPSDNLWMGDHRASWPRDNPLEYEWPACPDSCGGCYECMSPVENEAGEVIGHAVDMPVLEAGKAYRIKGGFRL